MALLDFGHREIAAKLVYFGPPGAGSNTNVRTLYGVVPAREKSRLHHFGPNEVSEESWYFDYVPPQGGLVPGFSTRFRVYSMPGGIRNVTHRNEVFRGLDAVIFVADARATHLEANIEAFHEVQLLLKDQGMELLGIPLVVQVNHTDAPDARSTEAILADLSAEGIPAIAAVARSSRGVIETHEELTTIIADRLRQNLGGNQTAIALVPAPNDEIERDEDVVARHLAALEAAEQRSRPSLEMAVQDLQKAMARRYATLTPGPRCELPFQPREFLGTRPVHLIESRLDGDHIWIDLVMERLSGGEPRRLSVLLANRPVDETPMQRSTATGTSPRPITSDLPDSVELAPPEPWDFPPVWYGIAGAAGGLLGGVLMGFLLFG